MSENREKDVVELKDKEMEQIAGGGAYRLFFSCPNCGKSSDFTGETRETSPLPVWPAEMGRPRSYEAVGPIRCLNCGAVFSAEEARGCIMEHYAAH